MHLELHLESPRLATHVGPLLATGVTLVIDHIGLPVAENPDDDPWLQTLTRMQDLSRLYVKLSAPYRTPFDTAQHIDVLHTLLEPNHLIWGSDWPHTRHESVTDYSTLASIRNRLGIASDAQAVRQLYGIE
jgi:predicted TIM-barrel fold metal-dependent hydrolase